MIKLFSNILANHNLERHLLLPQKVQQKINQHQYSSERLIAWGQMVIVATFAVLYIISPKTFSAEDTFSPVPWVLAAYFSFTAVHIWYTYRQQAKSWFVYLSIVVDIALIYILIWSFHLQYQQPAAFYLKVPTLLYVFIFIAMRALQFEIKFIIFSGIVAAVGWLLMILYAISDAGNSMITKDYVHYLTSNSILLGAEFDKIITILVVSVVLAAAVYRARNLLTDSVIDADIAEGLSHFVPDQVVQDIKVSDHQPLAGQAKNYSAAIMFTDVVAFTTLSEQLTPEQLVTTMNGYFAAIEKILDKYHGTINQFQGDAILASFDHAKGEMNPSECAVQAGLDIQKMLKNQSFGGLQLALATRIGINTGPVVGGFIGSTRRLIYTVHGDAVNLAARLEGLNKQYGTQILVSDDTRQDCRENLFTFTEQGETRVKGRSNMTRVFSVE